jgi:hypothetical protein
MVSLSHVTTTSPVRTDSGDQQIQDYLIATMRNVRILLAHQNPKDSTAAAVTLPAYATRLRLRFAF